MAPSWTALKRLVERFETTGGMTDKLKAAVSKKTIKTK
jgi:hypothetical protein